MRQLIAICIVLLGLTAFGTAFAHDGAAPREGEKCGVAHEHGDNCAPCCHWEQGCSHWSRDWRQGCGESGGWDSWRGGWGEGWGPWYGGNCGCGCKSKCGCC